MSNIKNIYESSEEIEVVFKVSSSALYRLPFGRLFTLYDIWTGASKTGTQLTSSDYTAAGESTQAAAIKSETVYSGFQITNASYHNIDLYATITWVGNIGTEENFPYFQKADTVEDWDSTETTAYDSAEVLVKKGPLHFSSTGESGNSNKNPISPANTAYWVLAQSPEELVRLALTGVPVMGDMHPIHDRAGSNYATSFKLDTRTIDGNSYNFFAVHLDGSTVTGDATLVARLGVGGANEHPYVDIFAPDSLGTRTLIDGGERTISGQSSGGESDTLGEMQEDRFQQFDIGQKSSPTSRLGVDASVGGGVGASGNTRFILTGGILGANGFSLISDGTHGTPRTGLTTRGKGIVGGCPYIISMIPA